MMRTNSTGIQSPRDFSPKEREIDGIFVVISAAEAPSIKDTAENQFSAIKARRRQVMSASAKKLIQTDMFTSHATLKRRGFVIDKVN